MYTVYVLRSKKDGNLYIGCTGNLQKRVNEHILGRVRATRYRRPLRVIYTEEYNDRYEAYRQERYYKTAKGKRELKRKLS